MLRSKIKNLLSNLKPPEKYFIQAPTIAGSPQVNQGSGPLAKLHLNNTI